MKVQVYKTNGCPWCEKVLKYFEKKGVEVEIKNCSESEEYREELIEKTKQTSVPVIIIDDVTIFGFDKKMLDVALMEVNQ